MHCTNGCPTTRSVHDHWSAADTTIHQDIGILCCDAITIITIIFVIPMQFDEAGRTIFHTVILNPHLSVQQSQSALRRTRRAEQ